MQRNGLHPAQGGGFGGAAGSGPGPSSGPGPAAMSAPPDGGRPGGGQGGPPDIGAIDGWVDQVLADGGIALPDGAADFLTHVAEGLEATVAAGGASLPEDYARHLQATLRDLDAIATHGDSDRPGGEGTPADTQLTLAIHKIDEFVDYEGANLSETVTTLLRGAQGQLEAVMADGVLDAAEQATVAAASDVVQQVLEGDFAKLSDLGLATLADEAAQARALATTGFLALDADQLAVFEAVDTRLSTLSSLEGGERQWAVHEIVDDLRFDVGGHLLDLADGSVPAPPPEHGEYLSESALPDLMPLGDDLWGA